MRYSQRGDDIHSDFRTRNEIQKGGYLVTLTIFPVKPGGCHCVYLAKFLLCHISADFAECSGVSWIVCIWYGCSSECKSLPTEKFLLGRTERKLFFFIAKIRKTQVCANRKTVLAMPFQEHSNNRQVLVYSRDHKRLIL